MSNILRNFTNNSTLTGTGNRINESSHYIFANDVIVLTCLDGYTWEKYKIQPKIILTSGSTSKTYHATFSNNYTVATFTILEDWIDNTNINIYGKPETISLGVPITYKLSNCTITPNKQKYTGATTFTASAKNGYSVNIPPILRYTDNKNEIHSVNFELLDDVYTLDTTSINSELLSSTSIEIIASAIAITVSLLNKLPNTITMSPIINNITFGDTITFNVKIADSVTLDRVYLIIDDTDITLTPVNNQYSYTFNNINENTIVSINASVTEKIAINYNLTRCTVDPNIIYYNGENNFYFTFRADENCIFVTPPIIQLTPAHTIQAKKISDTEYKAYFLLNESEINNLTAIKITATAILDENAVTNKYGIVSLFKVDKKIMREVMQKRFYTGTITELQNTDLANFITSLKWCYIDVESNIKSNIILGFCDTLVQAPIILDDDIELDLGTYKINGIYSNNLDINLIESIKVSLPFINDVELPSTCINKDIHIKYIVNVITGNCKAFIYDVIDNVDVLISSYDGNLSIDVPYIFRTGLDKAVINNNGISTNSNLYNVTPKIVVSEFIKTGDNIYLTDKYTQIKNETGYFKIDKIELKSNCLSSEKILIENLLKSGVYI